VAQVTFWHALFHHACNLTLLVWCRGDGIDLYVSSYNHMTLFMSHEWELTVGLYPR